MEEHAVSLNIRLLGVQKELASIQRRKAQGIFSKFAFGGYCSCKKIYFSAFLITIGTFELQHHLVTVSV